MTVMTLNRSTESKAQELEQHRAKGRIIVDETIGAFRLKFITDSPGQQMIYSAKEIEARAFLAEDPLPTELTPYPFIAAEIGTSSGATAQEVAQVYVTLAANWAAMGAQLEGLRIHSKDAVTAATSAAGVAAVIDQLEVTLDSLAP